MFAAMLPLPTLTRLAPPPESTFNVEPIAVDITFTVSLARRRCYGPV